MSFSGEQEGGSLTRRWELRGGREEVGGAHLLKWYEK